MSRINTLWECLVKRQINTQGAQWTEDSLILSHVDGKGISLFDPVARHERWEYRVKNEALDRISSAGDWIIIRGAHAIYLVTRSTGEGSAAKSLKHNDSFSFASDSHAIFVPSSKHVAAIMDLATGKVVRYPAQGEDLRAWKGSGDFFLASDLTGVNGYYTGRLESGTGRLLKAGAQPFKMPEAKEPALLAVSPAGFALTSAEEDVPIWIYSWSGKLKMALRLRGHGLTSRMGRKAKLLLAPNGELESLLVTYTSETRTRVFLLDLKNNGDISCSAEVVGPMFDTLPMIGDRLFWSTRGKEGGESIGMSLNLTNGKAAPFIDEPVSPWMATDGRGLFFGKEKKGQKHIAYGELVE